MLTVAWSLYNEFYGLRPWIAYQNRFVAAYVPYLRTQLKQRKADEAALKATPEYQKLAADLKAATDAAAPTDSRLSAEMDLLDQQRAAMTDSFQLARGKVGALTYELEQIPESDKDAKASKLKDLNDAKAEKYDVNMPVAGGGTGKAETELRPVEQAVHRLDGREGGEGRRSAETRIKPSRTRRRR